MPNYLKIVFIFICLVQLLQTKAQDVFRFSPAYKFNDDRTEVKSISFITYKSNSQLIDLVNREDNYGPLFALDRLMSAASNEEKNAITLENSDRSVVDNQNMKEKSIRYKSGLARIFVNSQFMIEYNDALYSYIKYTINFQDKLLDSIPGLDQLNNISGLQVVVKRNDKWLLTQKHPVPGFYFSYYNCSTHTITELLTGARLVNGKPVVVLDGIVEINRLVEGMADTDNLETGVANGIEIAQDTIKLSYYVDREIEEKGYWVSTSVSGNIDPSRPITEYNNEQIKLLLAVNRAIIQYTSDKNNSSISLKNSDLALGYDLISKTHIIKYGYCDLAKKAFIFKIQRNGPFEIKAFTVCVNVVNDEFLVEFQSDEPAFSYVDYISSSMHSRLKSHKFDNPEKNADLSDLKTSCMSRVGYHTVIDFECFSDFIDQLSEDRRKNLRN